MIDSKNLFILIAIALTTMAIGCKEVAKDYPFEPVPFTSVKVTDNFWAPRILKNHNVTIPIAIKQCEQTGRIKNFKIAGKLEKGSFCSLYPFDDSDIYKIIEGASFSLQTYPDKQLEEYLDTLIHFIALAQEADGYLYTNRTINPDSTHEWAGKERWVNDPVLSHELYNLGHLYEAAVAHYEATGKKNLLDVALKSAELVNKEFGPGKLKYYPGHQVIEMGLVKLYRATGDERYLQLAKFFLDTRGPGGEEYNQAQARVFDQDKIVGHAVRATYMYAGMADVAALLSDPAYSSPLFKIWDDLISTKYYITGGIGSSGSNEGFGEPYDLPNMAAYCETCASIGLVFWNYRMFLLTGESKYYDILERTLYNALMSGVSLSGDHFFYPNVLESRGQHERSEWFGCACCPGNICRFLPSLPGYIYAVKKNNLYTNLYINSTAKVEIDGVNTEVEQVTNFPHEGVVKIILRPAEDKNLTLKLRVPSWVNAQPVPTDLYQFTKNAEGTLSVSINGSPQSVKIREGYISLTRKWKSGDEVLISFPMEVRMIKANPKVTADKGKYALQRGPIIYCLEWPDNSVRVQSIIIDTTLGFKSDYQKDLLNGVTLIKGTAHQAVANEEKTGIGSQVEFTAIPYYAWANRGAGDMVVWMAINPENAKPVLPPSLASTSKVEASEMRKSIFSIYDQELPDSSNDHSIIFYHVWPKVNTTEWIEYTFKNADLVSESSVYWFDDGPFGGCRVPLSWRILYKQSGKWLPVKNSDPYKTEKNTLNTVHFEKVKTSGLRLEITLQKDWSAGLYEWSVK